MKWSNIKWLLQHLQFVWVRLAIVHVMINEHERAHQQHWHVLPPQGSVEVVGGH